MVNKTKHILSVVALLTILYCVETEQGLCHHKKIRVLCCRYLNQRKP